MIVDRAWAERNIGFDPAKTTAPAGAYVHRRLAAPHADLDDLQREIIDFDSEGPEGAAFLAFTKSTGLSRFTDIPWPAALAPETGPKPGGGAGPLPRADALVVTWTVDEGHALSRVLTPGKDSRNDYVPYTLTGLSRSQQATLATNIYKAFGRWSSVCSAIVCWALIAAL